MANEKDVLRTLAQDALERGVHPDSEQVLREYVKDSEESDKPPSKAAGSGKGT